MGQDVLQQILAARRKGLAEAGSGPRIPALGSTAAPLSLGANRFLAAILARRSRAIIAEVKLGSPTLGSLVGRFDPERLARTYANHGAACLSVVVEPDFFFGSYDLLARCVAASGLPAIAKDFVVDEVQLDHALAAGASAILLVASLYRDEAELVAWAAAARTRGLVPLIETHNLDDLAKLGSGAWELVGVNNRDLTNFTVGVETSVQLKAHLPAGALKVSESGIKSFAEVDQLGRLGYDAFLVGESLLLAPDPGAKLAELMGASV